MNIRQMYFGGIPLVHGVSWMPLIGAESEKEELSNLILQHEVALQVRIQPDESVAPLYGFVGKDFLSKQKEDSKADKLQKSKTKAKKAPKDLYSMGAILAGMCRNGTYDVSSIFLISAQDGEDTILMVVVENGVPASGGEYAGVRSDVHLAVKNWLKTGETYSIYTDNDLFHESAHPFDAEEAFSSAPDAVKKLAKLGKAKVAGSKKGFIALGIVALAVTGAMWDDINRFVNPPPPPPPPTDFGKLYQGGLKTVMAQAGIPGKGKLDQIVGVVGTAPTLIGGWRMDISTCDSLGCTLEFVQKAKLPANNQTFMEAKPAEISGVTFAMDGKRITARYGSAEQFSMENKTPISRDQMPSLDNFQRVDFPIFQDLVRVGLSYTFEAPAQLVVEGVPLGKVPAGLIVRRGAFTLNGKAWMLKDVPIPNNMIVGEIKLNTAAQANATFTIKGYYYVQ